MSMQTEAFKGKWITWALGICFKNMTLHVSCMSPMNIQKFSDQRWSGLHCLVWQYSFPIQVQFYYTPLEGISYSAGLRHFSVIHGTTKVGPYQVSTDVIFHAMHLLVISGFRTKTCQRNLYFCNLYITRRPWQSSLKWHLIYFSATMHALTVSYSVCQGQ